MSSLENCPKVNETKEEIISRLKKIGVELVDISKLKPHEEVSEEDQESLKNLLLNDDKCILKYPIVCEKKYKIILDGHNRYNIFKKLKLKKIPVYFVDYFDERIVVGSWREGVKVTKEEVIGIAKKGKCFPPKTTKHMYLCKSENEDAKLVRIVEILPRIDVSLKILANDGL
ncbi:MAG: hypothetical protein QW802_04215 [Candidatus Altiarchaeota archaeon]